MTEHLTTSRGDRIGYDRRGEGPAVIFVAGAGPFRAIDAETTSVAEDLATRGLATIVYDRLGRADSFRPGRIDLDDEIACLRALIGLAGGRATVCGHSSGCAIALRAAVAGLPVDALVLFEAPVDPASTSTEAWAAELYDLLDSGDHPAAVSHYMRDIPLEVLAGLRDSPLWEPFVRHADSLRPDAQALDWVMGAPHEQLLATVELPALVVTGTDTLPEMRPAAASLVRALPHARGVEVTGAQHTWEPGAMADLVAGFVGALDTSRRPARPVP